MTTTVNEQRWQEAQTAEGQYWDGINTTELLRIAAEKPAFLGMMEDSLLQSMFEQKDILEIGVGPLGISLASFYPAKHTIKQLTKVEPLAQIPFHNIPAKQESWAQPFVEWLQTLSQEGEYVRLTGEAMPFSEAFDTVIIYNVLDHVKNPELILKNAYLALRDGGQILIGVDCRSRLGQLQFEYILRRTQKGSVMVEAHPHTFLPFQVVQLLQKTGFHSIQVFGLPNSFTQFMGSTFRPAFVGKK